MPTSLHSKLVIDAASQKELVQGLEIAQQMEQDEAESEQ